MEVTQPLRAELAHNFPRASLLGTMYQAIVGPFHP
jgi:hypothetical protein